MAEQQQQQEHHHPHANGMAGYLFAVVHSGAMRLSAADTIKVRTLCRDTRPIRFTEKMGLVEAHREGGVVLRTALASPALPAVALRACADSPHLVIHAMCLCARHGRLDALDAVYRAHLAGDAFAERVVSEGTALKAVGDHAVEGGHRDVIRWCHDRGLVCFDRALEVIDRTGDTALLLWWCTSLDPRSRTAWHHLSAHAAARGDLDTLKLCKRESPAAVSVSAAARHGHLHVLQWHLAEHPPIRPWESIWIVLDARFIEQAAAGGHVRVLRWLISRVPHDWKFPPWSPMCFCTSAAENGHLEALQLLRFVGVPWWSPESFKRVVSGGHLHVLKWALASGCPTPCRSSVELCEAAAGGGHLPVLQWLREQGFAWDLRTCQSAALGGHTATLQWARANGCPWDSDAACWEAARNLDTGLMRWLLDQGCPLDSGRAVYVYTYWLRYAWTPADEAALFPPPAGVHPFLRWLRDAGAPWSDSTISGAASEGNLEVIKWAREGGCPWDEFAFYSAVRDGQLPVAKWLHANGCPFDIRSALRSASKPHYSGTMWKGPVREWVLELAERAGVAAEPQ